MAQGRGPQTTAKRVSTHLVQLGDFRQSRPFTPRGPRAWNCDRARPAVSVSAVHEEFGKPDLAPEEHDVLRNMEPSEIDAMADELYARDDLLGRYIRWA